MEYPCKDSRFKSSDHSIRLMEQIAKTKYVDKEYAEFLKLLFCYNKDSQSYTNEHRHDVSNSPSPNHHEDGDEDDDEVDPQYKMFLGNAKPDGRSYVVKFDTDDGFHVFVKYESEDGSDHLCGKQSDEVESRRFSANVMGNDRKRSIGDSDVDVDVAFEPFDPVTSQSSASKRKPGQEHTRRKPVSVNLKEEVTDDVDEDYLLLLENMICKNWGMKASYKSGHSFEYEAAEDEYDAEIHKKNSGGGIRKARRSNSVDASSVKYHDIVVDKCPRRSARRSEFRRKVMDLLKKPYDPDEYKELWKQVSIRKLMQRNMDLRNGKVKFYQTKKMGKSLLDHHKDLDSKLKVVENDYRKKLNILRGFFFWLQNLTQEEAFKPWNDVEFLTLVDES